MPRELLKGNVAFAEAAIRVGCEAYFGYPITPQTEALEHMAARLPELGRVFVQAESEVAAINMVYGAAAAGVRTMTSSSSPGVSLKRRGSPTSRAPRSRPCSSTSCGRARGSATSRRARAITTRSSRAAGTATTA